MTHRPLEEVLAWMLDTLRLRTRERSRMLAVLRLLLDPCSRAVFAGAHGVAGQVIRRGCSGMCIRATRGQGGCWVSRNRARLSSVALPSAAAMIACWERVSLTTLSRGSPHRRS